MKASSRPARRGTACRPARAATPRTTPEALPGERQALRVLELERAAALVDPDRRCPFGSSEVELAPVPPPGREPAAGAGHLPLADGGREVGDEDLAAAGLVGLIRDPAPVRRQGGRSLVEAAAGQADQLGRVGHRHVRDVEARLGLLRVSDEQGPSGDQPVHVERRLLQQRLLRAAPRGGLDPQVRCAPAPAGGGRDGDARAVRRQHAADVARQRTRTWSGSPASSGGRSPTRRRWRPRRPSAVASRFGRRRRGAVRPDPDPDRSRTAHRRCRAACRRGPATRAGTGAGASGGSPGCRRETPRTAPGRAGSSTRPRRRSAAAAAAVPALRRRSVARRGCRRPRRTGNRRRTAGWSPARAARAASPPSSDPTAIAPTASVARSRVVKRNVAPVRQEPGVAVRRRPGLTTRVAAAGVPPASGTFTSGPAMSGANTIVPSTPQLPPRPALASQTTCTGPPAASTFLRRLSAKKATERLSGDQNGKRRPIRSRERAWSRPTRDRGPRGWAARRLGDDERQSPAVGRERHGALHDTGAVGSSGGGTTSLTNGRSASRATPRSRSAQPKPATAAAAQPAARIQASRSRLLRRSASVVGTPACEPASPIQRSSLATSWALCQRSSGSFSRHFFTTWSSAGGIIGWTDEIGGGCDARIAAIRLVFDLPSKARRAVAIS